MMKKYAIVAESFVTNFSFCFSIYRVHYRVFLVTVLCKHSVLCMCVYGNVFLYYISDFGSTRGDLAATCKWSWFLSDRNAGRSREKYKPWSSNISLYSSSRFYSSMFCKRESNLFKHLIWLVCKTLSTSFYFSDLQLYLSHLNYLWEWAVDPVIFMVCCSGLKTYHKHLVCYRKASEYSCGL